MNDLKMYYYGERGLIDSILKDINKKQLIIILNRITKSTKEYKEICVFVEPSFGQRNGFGVPDLIIKAADDVFIIEAKCDKVEKELSSPFKWEESSKLNVQLLLRYRFINLLNKNNNGDYIVSTVNQENDFGDKKERHYGRKNEGDRITHTNWVYQLKGCNYYYVALTSDSNKQDALNTLKKSYDEEVKKEKDFYKFLRIITYSDFVKEIGKDNCPNFKATCEKFGYYNFEEIK